MMPVNDFWDKSGSPAVLIRMKEVAKGNMNILQQMLLVAETDSVVYSESPGVNLFLSDAYIGLQEELSLEFREKIEQEKLDEIINQNLSIQLDNDYVNANNTRRAIYHLNQGIVKSAQNSEKYEPIIKLTLGRIVMDERISKDLPEFIQAMSSTAEAFRPYR